MPNRTRLDNPTSHLPRLKFEWDSRVGPLFVIRYKKKAIGFAFCHRQKDRCLNVFGHTSFLCARCTGIVIGFILFVLVSCFNLSVPSIAAFGLMLPLIIDGISQLFNLRTSNNIIRLVTGILFTPGLLSLMVVML